MQEQRLQTRNHIKHEHVNPAAVEPTSSQKYLPIIKKNILHTRPERQYTKLGAPTARMESYTLRDGDSRTQILPC
jgi:hypothetical protein